MTISLKSAARYAALLGCLVFGGCLPPDQSVADEEKEPHFLEGRARVNAMDFDGAIQSFENALIANPRSASAHFELGWLYDQRKGESATAIYHYGRFLQAHDSGQKADHARTRITACKQQLASTVSLGPVAQNLQHEFDQLTEENRRLREENDRWRAYFVRIGHTNPPGVKPLEAPLSSPPAAVASVARTDVVVSAAAATERSTSRPSATPQSASLRTHTVKTGETPSAIARRYSIRVETLMAANPRVDARRMKVGETLNIPVN